MDTKELPPPYTPILNAPPATQFQDRDWVPSPVPVATFEPPYMNDIVQQQPLARSQPATVTTVTITPPFQVRGGCPVCHGTSWTGSYSCCAWLWCLCCFPCGIICCCCMRQKKCSKCGFTVG